MRFRITKLDGIVSVVEADFKDNKEALKQAKSWGWNMVKVEKINCITGEILNEPSPIESNMAKE